MKTKKHSREKIKNVTLKNDFYSFVNKKWINRVKIPSDDSLVNYFTILDKNISNQLKHLIKMSPNSNLLTIYNLNYKFIKIH